jgi:hypothetical protein
MTTKAAWATPRLVTLGSGREAQFEDCDKITPRGEITPLPGCTIFDDIIGGS